MPRRRQSPTEHMSAELPALPEAAASFARDGYAKVPGVLPPPAVAALLADLEAFMAARLPSLIADEAVFMDVPGDPASLKQIQMVRSLPAPSRRTLSRRPPQLHTHWPEAARLAVRADAPGPARGCRPAAGGADAAG